MVYEDGILENGLSWLDLVKWYEQFESEDTENKLTKRLLSSLDSPPEKLFFRAYCDFIIKHDRNLPLLFLRYICIMILRLKVLGMESQFLSIKEWILCSLLVVNIEW